MREEQNLDGLSMAKLPIDLFMNSSFWKFEPKNVQYTSEIFHIKRLERLFYHLLDPTLV